MTDKEKLEKLFTEFGIGYIEYSDAGRDIIHCDSGDARIDGYGYFYARFEFDGNGKFIAMGIWE